MEKKAASWSKHDSHPQNVIDAGSALASALLALSTGDTFQMLDFMSQTLPVGNSPTPNPTKA